MRLPSFPCFCLSAFASCLNMFRCLTGLTSADSNLTHWKNFFFFILCFAVCFLVSKFQQFTFQLNECQNLQEVWATGMAAGKNGGRLQREQELPFHFIWLSHGVKSCPKLVLYRQEWLQLLFWIFSRGGGKQSCGDVQSVLSVTLCHTPVSSWSFQFDALPEFQIQHVQHTCISRPVKPTKINPLFLNCERTEI